MSRPTAFAAVELPVHYSPSCYEATSSISDDPPRHFLGTLDSHDIDARSPIPSILSDSKYTLLEEYEIIDNETHEALLSSKEANDVLSSSCACQSEHAMLRSIDCDRQQSQPASIASIKLEEKMKRWYASKSDEDLIDDNVASWNLNDELLWTKHSKSARDRIVTRPRISVSPQVTSIDELLTRIMRKCRIGQIPDYEDRRASQLQMLRAYIDWARNTRKAGDHALHQTCGSVPSVASTTTSSLSNSDYMWVEI